jgi:lantibiotic biosynthesis protein
MSVRQYPRAHRASWQHAVPRFEPAGFFLVRAPLLPATTLRELLAASPGEGTGFQGGVTQLLRDPLVACAISAASPALFGQLAAGTATSSASSQARALRGLFRYLNRMSTRPTPYGLFAGVSSGRFESSTSLQLAALPLSGITVRPDRSWLESVVSTATELITDDPGIIVLASQTAFERGQRISLGRQATQGQDAFGEVASIKASTPVRVALELASEPIALGELFRLMRQHVPAANQDQLIGLLHHLLDLGFLIRDLTPPAMSADPCRYAADRIPVMSEAAQLAHQLRDVADELHCLEKVSQSGLSPADLEHVESRQRAITESSTGATLHIDAALSLTGRGLNWQVGRAVADAVTALAATAHLTRPHLAAYAAAFTEEYGIGAEIPVLELLDPHWGLDAPTTYLSPPPRSVLPVSSGSDRRQLRREQLLMSWIVEAILESQPVVLSDERIEQLTQGLPSLGPCPLVEAYVQVHAASRAALDRGDWVAVIGPQGIVPGGRSFGRFWQLLDPATVRALREYIAQERQFNAEAVYAELSYRPAEARMANVNGHPPLRDFEIPVNLVPSVDPDKVLALSDLMIGVDDGVFYIKSRSLGREVIVRQSHMLSPLRAPNVCRFLLEVSAQRDGVVPNFDDALFEKLPFTPRVIRGQVVLRPACWNLTAFTLPTLTAGESPRLAEASLAWRDRMRVPRHVYLGSHDQRLLLDLDNAASLAELEHALRQLDPDPASPRHYLKIEEALPGFDGAWLEDELGRRYFSELVVPLAPKASTAPPTPTIPATAARSPVRSARVRLLPPGGRWTYLNLLAAPDRHDQIITSFCRFAAELEARGLADGWFFMRYVNPTPQIRARVRSSAQASQNEALTAAVAWAGCEVTRHMVRQFSVDTYHPEIDRYGGEHGIKVAEAIFHGDSAGVGAVIHGRHAGRISCDPLLATAFTLDCLLSSMGLDDGGKLQLDCLRQSSFRSTAEYRERRVQLIPMLHSARGIRPEPAARILGDLYAHGAAQRRDAAAAAEALWGCGELERPWPSLVVSLAHMHVNRMLGVERAIEVQVYALLRSSLRSVLNPGARETFIARGKVSS